MANNKGKIKLFRVSGIHSDYLDELPHGNSCVGNRPKVRLAIDHLLHRLYISSHIHHGDNPYTRLNGEIWAKITSKRTFLSAREILISAKIIECDNNYDKGRKSKGYRLLKPWFETCQWRLSDHHDYYPTPDLDERLTGWGIDKQKALFLLGERLEKETADGKDWQETFDIYSHIIDDPAPYHYFHIGRTNRVFTLFNSLPAEVRGAITFQGQPTVEIDVANSQMILLHVLYKGENEESLRYRYLAESGKVYEFFGSKLGISRAECKGQMVRWLGGQKNKQIDFIFFNCFPLLSEIIKGIRKEHFKALIYKLQILESDIITDIPCSLSIHDGVAVPKENKDKIIDLIDSKFGKLGLTPTLKVA